MAKKNNPIPDQIDSEEDFEPEYEDDVEDDVYQETPDQSSYFTSQFSKEQLVNAHQLRNTPYKEEIIQLLKTTTLSPSAKRAIKTFAEQFLSERTILANLTNLEYMTISYDLAEVKMKTNFWPSDLSKPILFHILGLIRNHYTTICTNATGEWRERMLNGKQTMAMENTNINMNEPRMRVPDPNKRKGLLG